MEELEPQRRNDAIERPPIAGTFDVENDDYEVLAETGRLTLITVPPAGVGQGALVQIRDAERGGTLTARVSSIHDQLDAEDSEAKEIMLRLEH